jgi:7,8-dihydropterin-6-yl-methyl-4-(beta-D-ribofuranosyl)aminobenzene 5'-phosphate synthase
MHEPGAMTITILVDNLARPGLKFEHGFSAWIEVAGRRVLFDTGQGMGLAGNAEKLGIDLRTTDILVLSHGHYDHTGGLPFAIAQAPTAEIHVHPAATHLRYALRNGIAKAIAMPEPVRTALERHPVGVSWTTQAQELTLDLGLTGPIPRLTNYEDTGGPFFVDSGGNEPDPIVDDMALWIRTGRGLVVVLGCGHAGLVNSVRHALKLSRENRLHAVLGGFHLNEASELRLGRTMAELQELAPELVVPCHCTGETAVERLKATFGEHVVRGAAGAVFRLGGALTRAATDASPMRVEGA